MIDSKFGFHLSWEMYIGVSSPISSHLSLSSPRENTKKPEVGIFPWP